MEEVNFMKRVASLFVCGALSIVVFISVGYVQKTLGADKTQISIAAGEPGALLYVMASGVCNVINRENPTYNVIVEQTGGARENFSLLANKKVEIGFGPDNFGLEKYDGKTYLYGWATVDTDCEIVVSQRSNIYTVKDLKGKKVSLGPAGSAANVITSKLLSAYGIGEKDFEAQFLGWEKASDAMIDGLLDAATFMGVWPISSLQSLAMRKPIRILSIDPIVIKKHFSPAYHPLVIPAGAYPGVERVSTIGINAGAWFRGDLDEVVVYNIIKSIFANLDYLSKVHRACKQFRILSQKDSEELGVRVHPGVLRYAKEKGLW